MKALSLGSNILSLRAQRQFAQHTSELGTSMERLSSGLRINRGADDAAGLSIASSLSGATRVFTQGIRNLQDGVSMITIAAGAMTQLGSILTRQEELSEQAANGVYSSKQREALDKEAEALRNEYNRIIATTSFNGISLFGRDEPVTTRLQAGYGLDGGIEFTVGKDLYRGVGDGTFTAVASMASGVSPMSSQVLDLNRDGRLDLIVADESPNAGIRTYMGNSDGTFLAPRSYVGGVSTRQIQIADLNGDGIMDVIDPDMDSGALLILMGNSDGSFSAPRTNSAGSAMFDSASVMDLNGDGRLDIAVSHADGAGDPDDLSMSIFFGNGDGTFQARRTIAAVSQGRFIVATDFDQNGTTDLAVVSRNTGAVGIMSGNGNGTFKAPVLYTTLPGETDDRALVGRDLNGDGFMDLIAGGISTDRIAILFGNGNGTFKAPTSLASTDPRWIDFADFNEDGFADLIAANGPAGTMQVQLGNGNGTFKASLTTTMGGNIRSFSVVDIDKNGVLDIIAHDYDNGRTLVYKGNTTEVRPTMARLDLTTQGAARTSLDTVRGYREKISRELGNLGAVQSRLSSALGALQTTRENYTAAYSRITDADIAAESAKLVRTQIAQQASQAVLAQANQVPRIALSLLS